MDNSTQHAVAKIFTNTCQGYLAFLVGECSPGCAGVFAEPQSLQSIKGADWKPYTHPAVQSPKVAYRAPIRGNSAVIPIRDIDQSTKLIIDNPYDGSFLEIVHAAADSAVDFTTLVAGPDKTCPEKVVVWSIFLGEPVSASRLEADNSSHSHGDTITAAEALALGFEFAKVESDA